MKRTKMSLYLQLKLWPGMTTDMETYLALDMETVSIRICTTHASI